MREKSIVINPDGTMHVRTSLQVGTTPFEQLLGGAREMRRELPTTSPDTPVSGDVTGTVVHSPGKNSGPRWLVRRNVRDDT